MSDIPVKSTPMKGKNQLLGIWKAGRNIIGWYESLLEDWVGLGGGLYMGTICLALHIKLSLGKRWGRLWWVNFVYLACTSSKSNTSPLLSLPLSLSCHVTLLTKNKLSFKRNSSQDFVILFKLKLIWAWIVHGLESGCAFIILSYLWCWDKHWN